MGMANRRRPPQISPSLINLVAQSDKLVQLYFHGLSHGICMVFSKFSELVITPYLAHPRFIPDGLASAVKPVTVTVGPSGSGSFFWRPRPRPARVGFMSRNIWDYLMCVYMIISTYMSCIYVCMYVYIYICMYVFMYLCTFVWYDMMWCDIRLFDVAWFGFM